MKTTREQWLNDAAKMLESRFSPTTLPALKVCIGFPMKGAMSKRRVLGCCVMPESCTDRQPQIYINPTIETLQGPQGILAVLAHELIHAIGVSGHGKKFKSLGMQIGLEGNMACSHAGDELIVFFDTIIDKLGSFPHSQVRELPTSVKPDKCRMKKCVCTQCGYTIRVASKWITAGVPKCPCCEIHFEVEVK